MVAIKARSVIIKVKSKGRGNLKDGGDLLPSSQSKSETLTICEGP